MRNICSAFPKSFCSARTRPFATKISGTLCVSWFSATRMALPHSCWCRYMSIASLGFSALRNSSSASLNLPSSSRYMAYLRCTSRSFWVVRELCARSKACSKAPFSRA